MRKGIEWVLKNKTSYEVAKALDINNRTVNRYQNGTSPIDRMEFKTAEKLYNYYLEEMEKMEKTTWEFEGYKVHDEQEVLRFDNNEGDTIGYVALHDHRDQLIDDLNNGADPIADGWEDGLGNTIDIEGWGSDE